MKREYFSPEKLALYFYQAICSVDYLHQNNLYYVDVKAANLLIFKDQKVKLGDMSLSIKVDKNDDPNEQKYYLKGDSVGYMTKELEQIYNNETEASKNQLFANDKHALIVTLTKTLNMCDKLMLKENDYSNLECI